MYQTCRSIFIVCSIVLFCISFTKGQSIKFDQLSYPFTTKKVKLHEQITLAYVQEGMSPANGTPTLLFIHGLGSYLPAWKKNIAQLGKYFHCIALDLPGYGKSSKSLKYSGKMSFFAQVIHDFIDHLQLKNVVLVGHSMGGQIALTTALKYPHNIQKLVLIAPAGIEAFSKTEADLLKKHTRALLIKTTSNQRIKQNLASNFYQNSVPASARFMIKDRIQMKDLQGFDAYCHIIQQSVAGMLDEPIFQQLALVKHPTLIIFGKQDALIPNRLLHKNLSTSAIGEMAQKQLSNSRLLMLDKAGHFVQFEQANQVNEAVEKFLKE